MGAGPGNYALAFYRGDTFRCDFTLWLDSGMTQPVDLTTITPKAEIRDKSGGMVIVPIELDIELPNIIHAVLSSTATASTPTLGVWDLQLTDDASGDVQTVLGGSVTVTPDVTDSQLPQ